MIWPENELAVQMFCRIGTRWRYMARGMQGAMFVAGVQWDAVYPLLDRLGLPDDDWADLLQQLEAMEQAALPVIRASMASKTK